MCRITLIAVSLLWCVASASAQQADSENKAQSNAADDRQLHDELVNSGISFLLEKGQDPADGSFSKSLGPGVTALALTALLENGVGPEHPGVSKGLGYLMQFRHDDGGFYAEGSAVQSYETSIAILCLTAANSDGRYDETIQAAAAFLRTLQWDEGEGHGPDSTFYGGVGYGNSKRPDLSNTHFWIEAMIAAGEDPNSTAMQNAIRFNARCQNLATPENTAPYAQVASADDRGGFIYTAANEGESKASTSETGGLRSYASMTYAGLKSFLYAGVDADDLRVKAALDWIRRHYDLQSNPGMDQQGVFYYYHVFAKALAAVGEPTIKDASGTVHDWRHDLIQELKRRQQADGSWVNPTDRWYEGDANLVTSYALLALAHCKPDVALGSR